MGKLERQQDDGFSRRAGGDDHRTAPIFQREIRCRYQRPDAPINRRGVHDRTSARSRGYRVRLPVGRGERDGTRGDFICHDPSEVDQQYRMSLNVPRRSCLRRGAVDRQVADPERFYPAEAVAAVACIVRRATVGVAGHRQRRCDHLIVLNVREIVRLEKIPGRVEVEHITAIARTRRHTRIVQLRAIVDQLLLRGVEKIRGKQRIRASRDGKILYEFHRSFPVIRRTVDEARQVFPCDHDGGKNDQGGGGSACDENKGDGAGPQRMQIAQPVGPPCETQRRAARKLRQRASDNDGVKRDQRTLEIAERR